MKQQEFKTLRQFLQRGGSLRMLSDVKQEDLDALYQYAQQLMDCQDAQGAKRIFYLLMRIDHWNYDYLFYLGICYQQSNEHEEAIFCFSKAGTIKINNPMPAFHAGISYLALKNKLYAKKSFNASMRWCQGKPEYTNIVNSIQQYLTSLTGDNLHDDK